MAKLYALMLLFFQCAALNAVTLFNDTKKPISISLVQYHREFPRPSHDKYLVKEVGIAKKQYEMTQKDVSKFYLQPGEVRTKNQIKSFQLAVKHNPNSWAYIIWGDVLALDDYVGLVVKDHDNKINIERFIWEGGTIFNNTSEKIIIEYLDSSSQNRTIEIASGQSVGNVFVKWEDNGKNQWKKTLMSHFLSTPKKINRLNGIIATNPRDFVLDLLIINIDEARDLKLLNHCY